MAKKLEVKDLIISFRTNNGTVKAVRDISFDLETGETLAIVGESGSGKSVTARAIMGILAGNAIPEGGEIIYDGQDLMKISEEDFHKIRGNRISMIFQDPLSSLNPIVRIGTQLTEAMILNGKANQREARRTYNAKTKLLAEAMKKAAEAAKYAKEQEAAGIAAVGKAEAEAIQAKALAEAEGIDRKAEAMKKYGQAAMVEMVMQALPEIAKNVAEPLSKVDKITMYGEGNSAKLLQDIVNGTTQITEGFTEGMGIDVKALLSGLLGAKVATGSDDKSQPSSTVININTADGKDTAEDTDSPEA